VKFPGRSQRGDDEYGGSWGGQLEADTSRAGILDDGTVAWPERVIEARRQWLEAQPDDFEQVGKRSIPTRRPASHACTCAAPRRSPSALLRVACVSRAIGSNGRSARA
jgi:hypothetical protein